MSFFQCDFKGRSHALANCVMLAIGDRCCSLAELAFTYLQLEQWQGGFGGRLQAWSPLTVQSQTGNPCIIYSVKVEIPLWSACRLSWHSEPWIGERPSPRQTCSHLFSGFNVYCLNIEKIRRLQITYKIAMLLLFVIWKKTLKKFSFLKKENAMVVK